MANTNNILQKLGGTASSSSKSVNDEPEAVPQATPELNDQPQSQHQLQMAERLEAILANTPKKLVLPE